MTNTATKEIDEKATSTIKAGKYLSFFLGAEEFAIPVSSVREIMGLQDITPVPKTPPYVRGVFNLRGRVIPVMDMRRKCGLPDIEYTTHACIIVVQIKKDGGWAPMGIVVDGVSEVVNISLSDTEPMPEFGTERQAYLLGVAKLKDKVKILLDIDRMLGTSEILNLGNAA